jgi:hypothetical protein
MLMSLFSVRSERAFCEALDYDLRFRWFLDMDMVEPSFDHSTFTGSMSFTTWKVSGGTIRTTLSWSWGLRNHRSSSANGRCRGSDVF